MKLSCMSQYLFAAKTEFIHIYPVLKIGLPFTKEDVEFIIEREGFEVSVHINFTFSDEEYYVVLYENREDIPKVMEVLSSFEHVSSIVNGIFPIKTIQGHSDIVEAYRRRFEAQNVHLECSRYDNHVALGYS